MFFVIAFSPTPGGAGLIELLFNGFLSDYVTSNTHATFISTLWRMISFYVFLFAGAVLVPNWINKTLTHHEKGAEHTGLAQAPVSPQDQE